MKREREIVLDGLDLLLLAGIAVASGIAVLFSFSTVWAWGYAVFNLRAWPGWVWFAIKLATAIVLFWILAWRQRQSRGPSVVTTSPTISGAKAPHTRLGQEIELEGIGALSLVAVAILSGIGIILLSPLAWGWCAVVLNVHEWSRWVWLGSGLVLLIALVVIRARSGP